MATDPYAVLLHTSISFRIPHFTIVNRLNQSYQILLENHQALKAQNDETLVRVGLEQQFPLNAILKGKQMEDDEKRGGMGYQSLVSQGESSEPVGLINVPRR